MQLDVHLGKTKTPGFNNNRAGARWIHKSRKKPSRRQTSGLVTLKAAEDWGADGIHPPGAEAAGFTGRYGTQEQAWTDSNQPSSTAAGTSGRQGVRWNSSDPRMTASYGSTRPSWGRRTQPEPGQPSYGPQGRQQGPVQPAVWTDVSSAAAANARVQRNGNGPSNSKQSSNGTARMPASRRRSAWNSSESRSADVQQPAGETDRAAGVGSRLRQQSLDTSGASVNRPRPSEIQESEQPPPPSRTVGFTSADGQPSGSRDRSQRSRGFWGRRFGTFSGADRQSNEENNRFWGAENGGDARPRTRSGPSGAIADDWAGIEDPIRDFEDGWGGPNPAMSNYASSKSTINPGETDAAADTPRNVTDAAEQVSGFRQDAESSLGPAPEVLEDLEDAEEAAEVEWDDGSGPDITLLAPSEVDELLPVVPTPEQMGASWGSAVDVWQRLGAAAFVTLITAKLNMVLVASGSLTFPLWGPLLGAANRNRTLRQSARHVGFWRTNVLEVEVERPQRRRFTSRGSPSMPSVVARPTVHFLLGDESGARSQLSLPFNRRYEQIQVGEAAEVLVLSAQSRFQNFKALKEVYLPVSGLWLSEYPLVSRNLFLDISLDIERQRRRETAEGAYDAALS